MTKCSATLQLCVSLIVLLLTRDGAVGRNELVHGVRRLTYLRLHLARQVFREFLQELDDVAGRHGVALHVFGTAGGGK